METVQLGAGLPNPSVPTPFGHVVPAATIVKSATLVPVTLMPLKFSVALPSFDSVTSCAPLVVPAATLPNNSVAGSTCAAGAAPVPTPSSETVSTGAVPPASTIS